MSTTLKAFIGEWHVQWATGADQVLQRGWKILIGTGQDGAKPPFFSAEYDVCVGFAILEPTADGTWTTVLSTDDQDDEKGQPLALVFTGSALRWSGLYQGRPLRIYISVAEAASRDEGTTGSLYGTTVVGDPDQVAVWGANDSPPSP